MQSIPVIQTIMGVVNSKLSIFKMNMILKHNIIVLNDKYTLLNTVYIHNMYNNIIRITGIII